MNPRKLERIPAIKAAMTPFPWHVALAAPLSEAREMMRQHEIHHLPVTNEAGQLVGVLTERDLHVAEGAAAAADRAHSEALRVSEVCVRDPFTVELGAPLDSVLFEMAERHIGSALVVKQGRLAGIFTSHDACRYFADFLREMFPDEDDVA